MRLAYYLLGADRESVERLSCLLLSTKQNTKLCKECGGYTESPLCSICEKEDRTSQEIIVVERTSDVDAIEATRVFRGKYHVLHGVLSPMEGIGPDQLRLRELMDRVQKSPSLEIIVALNPSVEGEATCLYIQRMFSPLPRVKISKIAYGLPMGGALEYADQMTIIKALTNRVRFDQGIAVE